MPSLSFRVYICVTKLDKTIVATPSHSPCRRLVKFLIVQGPSPRWEPGFSHPPPTFLSSGKMHPSPPGPRSLAHLSVSQGSSPKFPSSAA